MKLTGIKTKRRIWRVISAISILSVVILAAGCAHSEESKTESVQNITPFPEFTTVDLDGNEVTQEIFGEKKLTMVNVWGTFCSPCIQEMPALGELAEEYKEDMQILGIISDVIQMDEAVSDAALEEAKRIVEATKAEYTHLVTSQDLLEGFVSGISAVPTTFFVDQEGNIMGVGVSGARSKEKWQEIIEAFLE